MEKRIWEQIHNPDFKGIEFETFRTQAGLNSFTLTPRKWVEATAAIGIRSKAGRHGGGTYAHILKPTEASNLLGACGDDLVAYVAISLFAGLRAAELQKLDWSEIDLDSGHIEVTAAKSKTARRRLVPISENLRAWLEPVAQLAGPVAPVGLRNRLDDAKEAAGFKTWESSAMRHSYGSYRLAQCQDAAKVSLEMGNSPQMVFAHYRELVKPKDAEVYWNIKPAPKSGNVVAFEEAAA